MNILLGITGGISAYKACDFIIGLQKTGHEVRVIMTKNAKEFIAPLTISTLSKHPVASDMWVDRSEVEHIELAKWAEAFVVYPATVNIMAKFAHGIADDTLSTVYLALPNDVPKVVFPAANTQMLNHTSTRMNIESLCQQGVYVGKTRSALLACGDVGEGCILAPRDAIDWLNTKILNQEAGNV